MIIHTYEGAISLPSEGPSLKSVAVGLSRESRYAGQSLYWWPVALHTFVVCDLLPPKLKIHGLLHDAAECIIGDIPKPAKTTEMMILEDTITASIYDHLKVSLVWSKEADEVHNADRRALHGEVHTIGIESLREVYPHDHEAEALVWKYFKQYRPEECIYAAGACPREFMRRFQEYARLAVTG